MRTAQAAKASSAVTPRISNAILRPNSERSSRHTGSINAKSGIKTPKDLEGRVVGVNRGYTVTTGLWARGMLQSEYGVELDRITFVPTDDEHVAEFVAPSNVDYARFRGRSLAELLVNGEIDAAIGEIKVDSPDIKQLIPDARNAAFDYFRRTGVYPINHGLVVKN